MSDAGPDMPSDVPAPRKRRRFGRPFGDWFVNLPGVSDRVPVRYRPTLYLETMYNVGLGAMVCLFQLSAVVLKTVIDGTAIHLSALGSFFGGSSLFSPLVSWLGRKVPMKSLIIYPNLLVAALLLGTVSPFGGATLFTLIVGMAFVVRVFPRVGEMNMYRVNYPGTHRSSAVGLTKSVSAISALFVTLAGYWWICFQPDYYWMLYWLVAAMLVVSTISYARIPVSRRNVFAKTDGLPPHRVFLDGVKVFLSDRRFLIYQFGFSLAGFANHMAIAFVAEVLRETVIADRPMQQLLPRFLYVLFTKSWGLDRATMITVVVGFVFAVVPTILTMTSSPFWGRYLDRINPMTARSLFNTIQCAAYMLYAYGGVTLQVWPMLCGAVVHAIGNGGGTINWLTGSLYFAPEDRISLYNSVHVALTGLRGLIAPQVGLFLLSSHGMNLGPGLFWLAAALSIAGAVVTGLQGLFDPGPERGAG